MKKNILKIAVIGILAFALVYTAALAFGNNPKPRAKIVFPERGSIESGIVLITAEQENKKLSAQEIKSVRFEYSTDRKNWTLIKEQNDPLADIKGLDKNRWEARWDTEAAASGDYFLRAIITTFAGKTDQSPLLPIEINKEPVAVALASLEPMPRGEAIVAFDASQSRDADGDITSWLWDFGDGATGTGQFVQHAYLDTARGYDVALTVQDNKGAENTGHYAIESFFDVFVIIQDTKCICKSIVLRGDKLPDEGKALGPNADGKSGWGESAGQDDGNTLGPLNGNPSNKAEKGEKPWTGYGFEIMADIEGDPALCKEIQLVKSTTDGDNASWKGATADLDKNGANDIDVSTAAKCAAAGGVWDAAANQCTLEFPQSGTKYGPDTPNASDAGGAYETTWTFKKHPDKKIIWYDTPSFKGYPNGTKDKADFVAIVRGTDGKYCYSKFSLDSEKKASKDKEVLTETKNESGTSSVPGVP